MIGRVLLVLGSVLFGLLFLEVGCRAVRGIGAVLLVLWAGASAAAAVSDTTLIDAINGPGQLKDFPEAGKQVALADRIVITKTDLAKAPDIEALTDTLAQANPYAAIYTAVQGEIDPALLIDVISSVRSVVSLRNAAAASGSAGTALV